MACKSKLILAASIICYIETVTPLKCGPGEHAYKHGDAVLCHSLSPALPFAAAVAWCRRSGAHVATVLDAHHNSFLYSLIDQSSYIGAVQRQLMLRHPEHSTPGVIWAWMSGHRPDFVNVLDVETRAFYKQPDGVGFEGCMELMKHPVLKQDFGNSKWGDVDCRAPKPAICARIVRYEHDEAESQNEHQQAEPKKVSLANSSRGWCSEGFSRTPVTRLSEKWNYLGWSTCLSVVQSPADYDTAMQKCQQLHTGAVLWHAAHDQQMRVRPVMQDLPDQLWTGADRRDPLLLWKWQDNGAEVNYTAWAPGEPQEWLGNDCAMYDTNRGGLTAANCQQALPYICETPAEGCLPDFYLGGDGTMCKPAWKPDCLGSTDEFQQAPERQRVNRDVCGTSLCPFTCPAGMVAYAGTCYTVRNCSMTMKDAVKFCRETLNLQLVNVENSVENEFVRRQAARLGRPMWTSVPETGIPFSKYHKYVAYGLPDEPNEGPGACTIVWYDGYWMDVPCEEKFGVICSLPLRRTDCYRAAQRFHERK